MVLVRARAATGRITATLCPSERHAIGVSVRALLALFVTALLGTYLCACGAGTARPAGSGSSEAGTPGASSRAAGAYLKYDGDNDNDDHPSDPGQDDQALLEIYGHRASASTARAIAKLVEHYYAHALARDGASACSLLGSNLVAGRLTLRGGQPRDEI